VSDCCTVGPNVSSSITVNVSESLGITVLLDPWFGNVNLGGSDLKVSNKSKLKKRNKIKNLHESTYISWLVNQAVKGNHGAVYKKGIKISQKATF